MIEKIKQLFQISQLLKLHNINPMELQLGEAKLNDGETVIIWKDEELKVSSEVLVKQAEGEPTPLTDGTYTLENGDMFISSGGKVVEIKKAEVVAPEEKPEAPEMTEAPAPAEPLTEQKVKEIVEATTRTLKFNETEVNAKFEAQSKEISELKEANKLLLDEVTKLKNKSSEAPAKKPVSMFASEKKAEDTADILLRVSKLLKD